MDTVFLFKNASLVLRLVRFLTHYCAVRLDFLTVLYDHTDWIVRLKSSTRPSPKQEDDLAAFLREIGEPCRLSPSLSRALIDLEMGRSPIKVMQAHKIVVVSHGAPNALEVEVFRQDFIARLGFCPVNLA